MALLAGIFRTGEHWGTAERPTCSQRVQEEDTMHRASPTFALPNDIAITRKSKRVLCANF